MRIISLTPLLFVFVLVALSMTLAQTCQEDFESPCGENITNVGHGAVELCANCFICGLDDGVCPAFYSTGEPRDDEYYVLLRKGTADNIRPGIGEDYTIAYNTGSLACESFGGSFDRAQTKANFGDTWSDSAITGSTLMNSRDEYVQAVCVDVPKRPSCDICVDPDCTAIVKGLAYIPQAGATQSTPVADAIIEIFPQRDETDISMRRNATTNENGEFFVDNAYFGDVVVSCAAYGYNSFRKEITLKPGTNIIDCRMGHGSCDANCTVPSAQYGLRVCASACQGLEGCEFTGLEINGNDYSAEQVMNFCEGLPNGFFREIETVVDEDAGQVIVHGINCCSNVGEKTYVLFDISKTSGISTLITRRFNKVMPDGQPVFLNIISYKI